MEKFSKKCIKEIFLPFKKEHNLDADGIPLKKGKETSSETVEKYPSKKSKNNRGEEIILNSLVNSSGRSSKAGNPGIILKQISKSKRTN